MPWLCALVPLDGNTRAGGFPALLNRGWDTQIRLQILRPGHAACCVRAAENPVTARTIRYLPFFQREEVSRKLLRCRLFYGSLSVARNSSKDTHPLVAFGWQVLASVLSQISMA